MPVGRPQVSIRLGTTGRSDVEKDFAAIGDAGEAQAKRYQASWERASAEAERALEKQAKAAQRLSSIAPASSGASNMVNPVTGGSYAMADGRAQASAAAIAQQLDQGEASARRLLAAVDPLYAAQMRYDQALAEANMLQRQGLLVGDQYVKVTTGLKTQLDESTALYGKQGTAIGNTRIAQMELMHVVRGSVDQFAAGAPPMQIFTMHLGMLGQAAALSGESMGKFGAFMASGWGLGLTVAIVALGPMIAKLFDTGNAVDDLVSKLKKEAQQARDNDTAHRVFASTLDGVTDATRRNEDALKNLGEQHESAAQKALAGALANIEHAKSLRDDTQAQLDNARASLEAIKVRASGPGQRGELATLGVPQQMAEVDALQNALAATDAEIARNRADVLEATSRISVEAIEKMADPIERIKSRYEGPAGLIEKARQHALELSKAARAAGDEAKAQALVTIELQKQIAPLKAKEAAEIKAEQERNRKGPENAGGTAIFNDQIAAFFDEANKFRGMSETGNKGVLEAFFREANLKLDPEKTAWCAAFVNAVLANQGVTGTGSLAAKSFLNFGKDDTHSPQRGDIVVVKSGSSPSGEHVGFLDSIDKKGNVTVLGGNTGNRVATSTYGANQVLAVRRPPTPSESSAAADKAASAALQAGQSFASESEKLNQQYLQALAKVVAGYDAQAAVQLMRAQGEHDAETKQIDTNLAAGKYGEATSQLAQTRAHQLQIANDQVLSERKAAIALEDYTKFLQGQDAKNEQEAQFRIDDLQFRASIARTVKERRDLELQIIDIQFDEKQKHLEYAKALADLAGKTDEAARIQAEINNIPKEKARAQRTSNDNNKTPFDAYRDSLPKNMADAGQAIETSVVDGLKSLNSGLDDALMKSKNFKELWHNMGAVVHDVFAQLLKDLIDLAIKMFIIKPIMNLIGGSLPGFATGTESAPGGLAWVGEHGRELVQMPRGSKVFTAAESRRMAAANDAGPHVSVTNYNDFRGAAPEAVDGLTARLDQMEEELPGKIVGTMNDARERFVWRGRA